MCNKLRRKLIDEIFEAGGIEVLQPIYTFGRVLGPRLHAGVEGMVLFDITLHNTCLASDFLNLGEEHGLFAIVVSTVEC